MYMKRARRDISADRRQEGETPTRGCNNHDQDSNLVATPNDHFLAQDQSLDEDRDHKFQVDITGLVVTITCPSGQNYIDDKEKKNQKTLNENKNQKILENYSSDKNGLHKCNHDFLYLHAYGNKELPPPVPNPDYEPIQKKRQEVYDGLNQNSK
ncbi:T-cell surface glycoprotein CD3 epsilon chain isoform X7 [Phyllobates terribilis]|uniref:T-cell surface glycoprotein CD3 epsilon chain isoform X7 n=1 Tax=Phyllobates terribilis TaxID=111132 RepID=UPI003CCB1DB7